MDWLLTTGVVALSIVSAWLGKKMSRTKRRLWLAGFAAAFLVIAGVTVGRRFPLLSFVAPFSWLTAGRTEYVLTGPSIAMLFSTVSGRLTERRRKMAVNTFAAVAVLYYSVIPLALPLVLRGYLVRLDTQIDADGFCLQNTGFTCGPAAAVTALGRLGFHASEGELAVLSYANPVSGTDPDLLCAAISRLYGHEGLASGYRAFRSIDEVPRLAQFVALVRRNFFTNHYYALLEVTPTQVVVADPLSGRRTLSRDEFNRVWRFSGIVLERANRDNRSGRDGPPPIGQASP